MIRVCDVSKSYKNKVEVLKGVNFSIEDGEIVALLGHNGSGKSTLLKCITGVIKPTSGQITVDGLDSFRNQKKLRTNMGVVFNQKPSFIVDLTVMDNLQFFKVIYDISEKEFDDRLNTVDQYLNIHTLYDKQYRKLSFGERVKCEIASVLLHQPKYLFLDEPTIGLDYNAKKGLYELLAYLKRTYNTTILIVTHEVDYIQNICDHALIISDGEIQYDNRTRELAEMIQKHGLLLTVEYTEVKSSDALHILASKAEKADYKAQKLCFRILSEKDKEKLLTECLAAVCIKEAKIEMVTLREVLEDVLQKRISTC